VNVGIHKVWTQFSSQRSTIPETQVFCLKVPRFNPLVLLTTAVWTWSLVWSICEIFLARKRKSSEKNPVPNITNCPTLTGNLRDERPTINCLGHGTAC
jgi:hypothetical protein